ncbi:hypothetical protein [Fluviicola taffensis]|uniref:Lipoprotein n=1 Tax=Fluviicola taffensis (strain DSM 16823 / NCIMB 13979 / RW262) TaxID=755732 RepID=F2IA57_FLUTR|nr:hypothetical protein [Fluviicola taffensis]AEA45234.1 hypothetical protein Fluta_3261 [Fluviicola taffensis DSM 16823]
MNRFVKVIVGIAMLMSVSACSWNEYFMVSNQSSHPTIIQYQLTHVEKGFPIFTNQPVIYKLDDSNEINWDTKQIPIDLDTSSAGIQLEIPVNCAVVFGELNNDRYRSPKQEFINGRVFNLQELEILKNKHLQKITPENFDKYFKKINGSNVLEIK